MRSRFLVKHLKEVITWRHMNVARFFIYWLFIQKLWSYEFIMDFWSDYNGFKVDQNLLTNIFEFIYFQLQIVWTESNFIFKQFKTISVRSATALFFLNFVAEFIFGTRMLAVELFQKATDCEMTAFVSLFLLFVSF